MKSGAAKPDFPLRESVGAMVRMTHLAFAQDLQQHLAQHDIPVGMWFYLRALWEEDGLSQRVLSERVGATEATTAQQLAKMEARGHVERRRSQVDRRCTHVHLTRSGRALQKKLLSYAVTVNANALAGFTAADTAKLVELLARLRANLAQRHQARTEAGQVGSRTRRGANGRKPAAAARAT